MSILFYLCLCWIVCVCVCACARCSWWCQVVPNTVAGWQAVHQWSDWSKTTREEQAELPAAIRLLVSDGRGHAAPIRSARSCSTVGKSQRVFGDLVSLVTSGRGEGPRLRYERVNLTRLRCFYVVFYVFRGNICRMLGKKKNCCSNELICRYKIRFLCISCSPGPFPLAVCQFFLSLAHQHNRFLPKLW